MKIIWWISSFFLFFPWIGYPTLLYILKLFKEKNIEKKEITPMVSIVIPAYNEEKIIAEKIENTLSLDYDPKKLEIIITSESNDRTNEIIRTYEEKGIKLIAFAKRRGKQSMLYDVVPNCKGEIIVFTDANGMLEKIALKKIIRNFSDKRIGCVSGELRYRKSEREVPVENESLYWKYEVWLKGLESSLYRVIGANGSVFALRKELYSPLSIDRGDDFELPIRVAQQGYGVVWESEAISWEEISSTVKREWNRKIRIISWMWISSLILLRGSFRKKQWMIIFQIISHKILRWFMGIFMLSFYISSAFLTHKPFYLFFFILQTLFYIFAYWGRLADLRGRKSNRLANLCYYFAMVAIAAIVGIVKGSLNKQKATWEKMR